MTLLGLLSNFVKRYVGFVQGTFDFTLKLRLGDLFNSLSKRFIAYFSVRGSKIADKKSRHIRRVKGIAVVFVPACHSEAVPIKLKKWGQSTELLWKESRSGDLIGRKFTSVIHLKVPTGYCFRRLHLLNENSDYSFALTSLLNSQENKSQFTRK